MKDFIIPIISFLVGATSLAFFYRYGRSSASEALDHLSIIYTSMRSVVDDTPASRFLIFRGSNGGGIPRPGADLHIYLVHEAHKNPTHPSIKNLYSNIVADGPYILMLQELVKAGTLEFTTKDMPTGLQKIIYLSEDIAYSRWYYLGRTDTEIFYGSISTHTEYERFGMNGTKASIEIAVLRIREVFKKYT